MGWKPPESVKCYVEVTPFEVTPFQGRVKHYASWHKATSIYFPSDCRIRLGVTSTLHLSLCGLCT